MCGLSRWNSIRRMTLVTLGSPGLRAGKSPDFLVLRGLARSGRSRTKVPGARILSRNVANARSACSGGKGRDGVRRGGQGMGEADRVRGDARGGRPDPGDLADRLVDGEQCPHFLLHAGWVLAAQHRLPVAHVGLVMADDGLASPPPRVAARQIQRRVLLWVEQVSDQAEHLRGLLAAGAAVLWRRV